MPPVKSRSKPSSSELSDSGGLLPAFLRETRQLCGKRSWRNAIRLRQHLVANSRDRQPLPTQHRSHTVTSDIVGISDAERREETRVRHLRRFGEVSLRGTRAKRGHSHARIAQFFRERLRKAQDVSLGRVVDRHQRSGLERSGRRDVQYPTGSRAHHRRKKQLRQVSERADVDLDHLQLAGELGLGKLASETEASVVDEHLDWNVLVVQKVEDLLGCFRAPQVSGENVCLDVEFSLELSGGRLERVTASRDESDVEALSRELLGDLQSDTAGAAGYERGAAFRGVFP